VRVDLTPERKKKETRCEADENVVLSHLHGARRIRGKVHLRRNAGHFGVFVSWGLGLAQCSPKVSPQPLASQN